MKRRSIAQKVQMEIIKKSKNNGYTKVVDFNEYVAFILDGHRVYYFYKREVLLNPQKFTQVSHVKSPETLKKETVIEESEIAKKTNNLVDLDDGRICVKIKSISGKEMYCNVDYLNDFKNGFTFRISNDLTAVVVTRNEDVVAKIMGIRIRDKYLED